MDMNEIEMALHVDASPTASPSLSFNDLPVEIFLEIIDRIPMNLVVRLRAVCKLWRDRLDKRNWLYRVLCLKPSESAESFDLNLTQLATSRLPGWRNHLRYMDVDYFICFRDDSKSVSLEVLSAVISDRYKNLEVLILRAVFTTKVFVGLKDFVSQSLVALRLDCISWIAIRGLRKFLPRFTCLKNFSITVIDHIQFRDIGSLLRHSQLAGAPDLNLLSLRDLEIRVLGGAFEDLDITFKYDISFLLHFQLIRILHEATNLESLRIVALNLGTTPPHEQLDVYADIISTLNNTHVKLRKVRFENISIPNQLLHGFADVGLSNCCIVKSDTRPTQQALETELMESRLRKFSLTFDSLTPPLVFVGIEDTEEHVLIEADVRLRRIIPFPNPNLQELKLKDLSGATMTGFLKGLRGLQGPLPALRILDLTVHGRDQEEEYFLRDTDIGLIATLLPNLTTLRITTGLALTSVSDSIERLRGALQFLDEDPIIQAPPSSSH